MTMTPNLRKFALIAHITSSVGWLGAVVSFLTLAINGLITKDDQVVRAIYIAMDFTAWFVIVPLAIASLVTGLVQSLGTTWGLFRHYWILTKFFITILATALLMVHTKPIGVLAAAAKEGTKLSGALHGLQIQLVGDAVAAIALLILATTLSVYKPWGLTAYGRRKQVQRPKAESNRSGSQAVPTGSSAWAGPMRRPRWVYVVGIHAIGIVLLFVVLHLTRGGLPHH